MIWHSRQPRFANPRRHAVLVLLVGTTGFLPFLWRARAESAERQAPAIVSKASIAAHQPNYARGPQIHGIYRWRHMPVTVYFTSDLKDPGARYRNLVLDGFDEWSRVTAGTIWYREIDDPRKADVTVSFLPGANVPPSPTTLGRTNFTVLGPYLQKAQMTLAIGGIRPEELTEAAAHEWGHALGINGHSEDDKDIMYGATTHYRSNSPNFAPPPTRQVSRRDRNTLETAYPDLFPERK